MKPLFQTIVVAVSGSEASINASKYAIVMAKQYRCRLVAVNVVDTATLKELLLSRIFVEEESFEYERSLEENGQRYLNYIEELAGKKGVEVEKVLRRGAVFSEIINVAEEREADLILLGGFEEQGGTRDVLSRQHRDILRAVLHPRGEGAGRRLPVPEGLATALRGPRFSAGAGRRAVRGRTASRRRAAPGSPRSPGHRTRRAPLCGSAGR
jgi:nucleotide-binding universal stress UspA family protein